jgi:PEGA domain
MMAASRAGLHATIRRVSVFDETPSEAPSRRAPLVLGGLVVLAVVGAAVWMATRSDEAPPAAAATAAPAARPAPGPPRQAAAPAEEPAVTTPSAPRRSAASRPEPEPAAPPAPAARTDVATLVVESDVPGASVFVDREFVGTAPVTLKDVTPGTKRINLSAEGYEGVQRSVDVTPGEHTVTLRFKEVRLNASVGVSHKHGMGGCEGTLRATVDGLAYDTTNKGDAFSLPYAQIETFEVNYLEKNLRVKQRGGKTWNFTDRTADNADKLFVFHRDVQGARDKLAKGFTAAR